MNRLCSALLITCSAFALSSCGTAFRKEWNAAATKPPVAGSIAGAWEGTWLSAVNGHHGKLLCVVPEGDAGEKTFTYFATWGHFFRGSFSAPHRLATSGGVTKFQADRAISKHGTFHAEGTVSQEKFDACYQAAGDRGTFTLRRPQLKKPSP